MGAKELKEIADLVNKSTAEIYGEQLILDCKKVAEKGGYKTTINGTLSNEVCAYLEGKSFGVSVLSSEYGPQSTISW